VHSSTAAIALLSLTLIGCRTAELMPPLTPTESRRAAPIWPSTLPKYDHIVIVVEENKDYEQVIGNKQAPYINGLATEGASLLRMFAEEHDSQGNYFWLFSGDNHNIGFGNDVPKTKLRASNLGQRLIESGRSFQGFAQSLPAIGDDIDYAPLGCISFLNCLYARKHVPWVSFANIPEGTTSGASSHLRFTDFPSDYTKLPTVAFIIPDLNHDMHNGDPKESIPAGDRWLAQNLDPYFRWAKTHNSLLVVTFDENDRRRWWCRGLTDPAFDPRHDDYGHDMQNRIATIFAGARVKRGYAETARLTHVNLLRTVEAMYGLPRSGRQQPNAARAGIDDDTIITEIFEAR
jgi:acid phosphatase